MRRLLDSEFEDYLICALTTVGTITKVVGPLLRDVAEAAHGTYGVGVDVHAEERQVRRCTGVGLRRR
jgi:hypothetical protein